MLYTTYLANVRNIPKTEKTKLILVTRYTPKNRRLTNTDIEWHCELAPSEVLYQQYKQSSKNISWQEFKERFKEQCSTNTATLKGISFIEDLVKQDNDVYLICYEKLNDMCHRSILYDYLKERGNLEPQLFGGEYYDKSSIRD